MTTLRRPASLRTAWRTRGGVRESRRRSSSANPVLHISGSTHSRAPSAAAFSTRRKARSRFAGTSPTSTRNCRAAAMNGETGIGTPGGDSWSGDGGRDRHDHDRSGAGAFQGAGGPDRRGEGEPAPEIFPGVGRYRDHGRRLPVRNQVPPLPGKGLPDAKGHRADRVGAPRVFRRDDGGAAGPRGGEKGARGGERRRGGGG